MISSLESKFSQNYLNKLGIKNFDLNTPPLSVVCRAGNSGGGQCGTLRFGYDGLGLFVKYYATDMFDSAPQKGLKNMAFGVAFGLN